MPLVLSSDDSEPRILISSSLTIFIIICAGVIELKTSFPSASFLTWSIKFFTTESETSASNKARLISRIELSKADSSIEPVFLSALKIESNLSARLLNIFISIISSNKCISGRNSLTDVDTSLF